jgi:hypothetical protein
MQELACRHLAALFTALWLNQAVAFPELAPVVVRPVCTSRRRSAELCAAGRIGRPSAPRRSLVRPRAQAALNAPAPVFVLGGSIVPLGAAGANVTSQARARSAQRQPLLQPVPGSPAQAGEQAAPAGLRR